MEIEVLVYVDIAATPHLAGQLWARIRKGGKGATCEYDPSRLECESRFSQEPVLTLGASPFYTPSGKSLFGTIGDSAPDRWDRVLMRGAERAGETPRIVMEIDYLLRVDDEARQGALRFAKREDGPFSPEYEAARIPPLIDLPRLLSVAEHVANDTDSGKRPCTSCWPQVRRRAALVPRRRSGTGTVISPLPSFRTRTTRSIRCCARPYTLRPLLGKALALGDHEAPGTVSDQKWAARV